MRRRWAKAAGAGEQESGTVTPSPVAVGTGSKLEQSGCIALVVTNACDYALDLYGSIHTGCVRCWRCCTPAGCGSPSDLKKPSEDCKTPVFEYPSR